MKITLVMGLTRKRFNKVKVTVEFERCFQLSASNSVNTRRIPANLYINGKLIKFSI